MSDVLRVDSMSKRFGERVALADVSFSLRPGEFVGLLGPSGAGKSTLFRCIAGLQRADFGSALLGEQKLGPLHGHGGGRVAMVFQQFALVDRLSVLDNVLAGRLGAVAVWRGMLRRFSHEDRMLGMQCLDRVSMLDHAQQRADRLSGGQKQRVAIARALAQKPDVILADEPIASLDPTLAGGILELLRSIAKIDDVAVICSLHQLSFAREYSDRVIGIRAGQIVLDCPASALDDELAKRLYKHESMVDQDRALF